MPQPPIVIQAPSPGKAARSVWLRPELIASWWEIAVVLLLTQGYYIYSGYLIFMRRLSGARINLRPTDYGAIHLLAGECAILGLLLVYLHWRGWKPRDLKIIPTRRGLLQAILLAFANYAVFWIGGWIVIMSRSHAIFTPSIPVTPLHPHGHFGWAALIVWQAVNAVFEEVTCISYTFNQVAAKRGPFAAFTAILLLRASYHIWKSPSFLLITVIAFSIYCLLYWRTRNVWPLIAGHFLYDVVVSARMIR